MQDFVNELILAVDGVVAIDGGAESTRELKEEDGEDAVDNIQATLHLLATLVHSLRDIFLVALEKVESHKVDVVGKLLYFDHVSQ